MAASMPASTTAGGMAALPGPLDFCITPAAPSPVPMPYPNIAQLTQAKNTTTKVKFGGKPVVTKNSNISRSSGDEPGVQKGQMSAQNMSKAKFLSSCSKVKTQGKKPVYPGCMTSHNGNNANVPGGGAIVAPSQTKVLIAP